MKTLFLWEIRKNVKKNAIIGLAIAAIVVLVLYAVAQNYILEIAKSVTQSPDEAPTEESTDEKVDYSSLYKSREELILIKAAYEENLRELERDPNPKSVSAEIYQLKAVISELDYALDNGFYDKEVAIVGLNYWVGSELSAETFLSFYGALIAFMAIIYGIVLGARLYTNEYKSGTIKYVMTRPIKKRDLTGAKLLSLIAILSATYLVPCFIGWVYGAIAFGTEATKQVIISFNGGVSSISTVGALTFGSLVCDLLRIIVMGTVAFTLGTVTRKSTVGLIIPLVITLGIGTFLETLGIYAFTLTNSFNLMQFFGAQTVVKNGNFFTSLATLIFWMAGALAALFLVTEKRDIY